MRQSRLVGPTQWKMSSKWDIRSTNWTDLVSKTSCPWLILWSLSESRWKGYTLLVCEKTETRLRTDLEAFQTRVATAQCSAVVLAPSTFLKKCESIKNNSNKLLSVCRSWLASKQNSPVFLKWPLSSAMITLGTAWLKRKGWKSHFRRLMNSTVC